jgi:DNA repair protein RecN (Recombination protein N)
MRAFHDAVVVLQSDAAELAAGLSRAAEEVEYEPEELEMLGARLDLIENLKRKYGGSLHAVLHERARFAEIVERFSSRDERLAVSRAALRDTDEELTGLCARLTRARTEAARGLEQDVAEELHGLSMPAARLVIDLEPLPRSTARGAESVTFMLAPNPGAGLKRLADIASGGELSRVLLALFAVLADRREQTMLLFDEIDAGIGGVTAGLVGARLRALAESSQVLCVTHAAQIAAWADAHYVLRKQADGRGACIEIQALKTPESARDEIARMLSGTLTQVARDHAQTLLIGTARSQ